MDAVIPAVVIAVLLVLAAVLIEAALTDEARDSRARNPEPKPVWKWWSRP